MAITAVITSLTPSTVTAGQPTTVLLTTSNSGGVAVTITGIQPRTYPASSLATDGCSCAVLGVPFAGPGANVNVPASGTNAQYYTTIVPVPQGGYWAQGGSSETWTVDAIVYTSDGSVTLATSASLTVNHYP